MIIGMAEFNLLEFLMRPTLHKDINTLPGVST